MIPQDVVILKRSFEHKVRKANEMGKEMPFEVYDEIQAQELIDTCQDAYLNGEKLKKQGVFQ
jgi:hypothetical protein